MRSDAGWTQPAHMDSMSAPSASPMEADACLCSCASTMARWYTAATSDCQQPRCRVCTAAASPKTSHRSVGPPMRQHLPPKLSMPSPSRAAYRFARARESSESHARVPPSIVKSGIWLGWPKVQSATAPQCCLSTHNLRSASYAQTGSSSGSYSQRRLLTGSGTALCLARGSLVETTCTRIQQWPLLAADGSRHFTDAHV
eukprot:6177476-Pleurochrysis_carterae.AAC.1